jgi:mRNA interferase MazF
MGMVKRGEVYWVNLDPTVGTQIKKTRPCLIVSPDDLNTILPRVIVAPLTSKGQTLGCRPDVDFAGKKTRVLLDQIRTIDKQRLLGNMGEINHTLWHPVLLEMLQ